MVCGYGGVIGACSTQTLDDGKMRPCRPIASCVGSMTGLVISRLAARSRCRPASASPMRSGRRCPAGSWLLRLVT